jgi:molybdenum cofactor cytidylyltransferase
MQKTHSYGIIILAAGNSSRLGEPKQLLRFNNKSLITHVAEEAIDAIGDPVKIVTGASHQVILNETNNLPVQLIYNENWQQGMGSSISAGLNAMLNTSPSITGVILTVSDQPFVSSALFSNLIKTADKTRKGIIASAYDNTVGTPVLFQSPYFDHLLNLKGSEGAKKILKRFKHDVAEYAFPQGSIDIDTKEDYNHLLKITDQ